MKTFVQMPAMLAVMLLLASSVAAQIPTGEQEAELLPFTTFVDDLEIQRVEAKLPVESIVPIRSCRPKVLAEWEFRPPYSYYIENNGKICP